MTLRVMPDAPTKSREGEVAPAAYCRLSAMHNTAFGSASTRALRVDSGRTLTVCFYIALRLLRRATEINPSAATLPRTNVEGSGTPVAACA